MVRLQKFLAEAGVGSRRACEGLILGQRVAVNGEVVAQLGSRVNPLEDQIAVDGRVVRPRKKVYLALNKPPGCLCTRKDPGGRRTVLALLPPAWRHLYPVGRLDYESEGLLFLANDGNFALRLTHPRFGVPKVYRVTLQGLVVEQALRKMVRGVVDQGERLRARKARLIASSPSASIVEVELVEGKNREIRRLMAGLGLPVVRLQRISVGPVHLSHLPPGRWRPLTEAEIKSLLSEL